MFHVFSEAFIGCCTESASPNTRHPKVPDKMLNPCLIFLNSQLLSSVVLPLVNIPLYKYNSFYCFNSDILWLAMSWLTWTRSDDFSWSKSFKISVFCLLNRVLLNLLHCRFQVWARIKFSFAFHSLWVRKPLVVYGLTKLLSVRPSSTFWAASFPSSPSVAYYVF